MLRFAFRCLVSLATLSGLCLFATGCRVQPSATAEGALSIPPAGQVRVVSRRISETPERLHWKWSVIGERNWKAPAATDTELALAQSYTLNDPLVSGGCNIWECDLVAERRMSESNQPVLQWTTIIHGSDGSTRQGQGSMPLENAQKATDAVQIRADRDTLLRLPAQAVLARMGGSRDITLKIASD